MSGFAISELSSRTALGREGPAFPAAVVPAANNSRFLASLVMTIPHTNRIPNTPHGTLLTQRSIDADGSTTTALSGDVISSTSWATSGTDDGAGQPNAAAVSLAGRAFSCRKMS